MSDTRVLASVWLTRSDRSRRSHPRRSAAPSAPGAQRRSCSGVFSVIGPLTASRTSRTVADRPASLKKNAFGAPSLDPTRPTALRRSMIMHTPKGARPSSVAICSAVHGSGAFEARTASAWRARDSSSDISIASGIRLITKRANRYHVSPYYGKRMPSSTRFGEDCINHLLIIAADCVSASKRLRYPPGSASNTAESRLGTGPCPPNGALVGNIRKGVLCHGPPDHPQLGS
jgi:hypothetical protein